MCLVWSESWYAILNWQRIWSRVESSSLCMYPERESVWIVWMVTEISGLQVVMVKRCPFMRSERQRNVSPVLNKVHHTQYIGADN